MLCDRCRKNYPIVKITKYGNEYLCDNCIIEELGKDKKENDFFGQNIKEAWSILRKYFRKKK